jgi:hypothetical protein
MWEVVELKNSSSCNTRSTSTSNDGGKNPLVVITNLLSLDVSLEDD